MTMTPDLIAFLTARLDEEHIAAGMFASEPEWNAETLAAIWQSRPDDPLIRHAAYYDPARALREVEAKRALVRRCEQQAKKEFDNAMEEDRTWVLWPVLFELAAIWSDHPDYDQAWKPS